MMKTGLLWYDGDTGRDLTAKVARAAAHYQQKYGHAPRVCFVNPTEIKGDGASLHVAGIEVLASKTVLPHHFWLGVKEEDGGREAKRK